MNSTYLNELIEQAMLWTDFYTGALLVPMTCWIAPPKMKQVSWTRIEVFNEIGIFVIKFCAKQLLKIFR